ncbi:uncharacterized protein AtWU_00869 [Aspergillus tubingensis]|uniref:uncharacterized protein n=1 Tax=Aspergillus tubingensis TaxID=5068 RepID=UPI00157799CC|nr:uncharacterized protein AtWU_00869 [Aspergillus tubingensis]GFN11073.1 hypothetical protein AtWU_00869 [Aspergillus tubingensis]
MSRTYATPAALITISILFPVLGTLTVILRFYTRRKTKSVLWIDDWLTLPALIQYFADIVTVLAFGFTKLSILYFYRSIFCSRRTIRTAFHSVTMCMIVLVLAWTIVFGFGMIFICGVHPDYAWGTIAVVTTECSLQVPLLEGYAISDFILDVIIWLLPLPRIWLLNISVRQRVGLGLVFLVGLLAIAASATRMAIYIAHLANPFAETDGETLVTYLLFWTMAECGLGVIVICLPPLRPMYSKIGLGSYISSLKRYLYRRTKSTTSSTVRLNNLNSSVVPSSPSLNPIQA